MNTWTYQVFVGGITALPGSGRPSAIVKRPVAQPVAVTAGGLAGDAQADTSVHGGPEKAVHCYPSAHYSMLAQRFPALRSALVPGVLGENLSVSGLTEADVHVGDEWRVGSVLLQVCQPRMPCWKIDARLGLDGVAAFIEAEGLTGWYCRVLELGEIQPEGEMGLSRRSASAMTLAHALRLCAEHRPDLDALRALAHTPGVSPQWATRLLKRADYLQRLSTG